MNNSQRARITRKFLDEHYIKTNDDDDHIYNSKITRGIYTPTEQDKKNTVEYLSETNNRFRLFLKQTTYLGRAKHFNGIKYNNGTKENLPTSWFLIETNVKYKAYKIYFGIIESLDNYVDSVYMIVFYHQKGRENIDYKKDELIKLLSPYFDDIRDSKGSGLNEETWLREVLYVNKKLPPLIKVNETGAAIISLTYIKNLHVYSCDKILNKIRKYLPEFPRKPLISIKKEILDNYPDLSEVFLNELTYVGRNVHYSGTYIIVSYAFEDIFHGHIEEYDDNDELIGMDYSVYLVFEFMYDENYDRNPIFSLYRTESYYTAFREDGDGAYHYTIHEYNILLKGDGFEGSFHNNVNHSRSSKEYFLKDFQDNEDNIMIR